MQYAKLQQGCELTDEPARIFVNSLPKAGTNLVSRAFDLAGFHYDKLGIAGTLVLGNRYIARQLLRRSVLERDPALVGLEVPLPLRRASTAVSAPASAASAASAAARSLASR